MKRVLLLPLLALACLLALAWAPVAHAAEVDLEEEAGEVMGALKEAVQNLGEEEAAGLREAVRKGKEALEGGVPIESIVERLDKLEREQKQQQRGKDGGDASKGNALSVESLEDDSKSLLEIVSQTLFDYVTTRLTPRTDRECSWSYAQGKCVPKCKCKYQFQLGDYTLSRSCRLNPNATEVASCDPLAHDESDDNMLVKAQRLVSRSFVNLNKALDKYAPATDPECDWRWSTLRCEPRDECRFYYKLGDYHIGRSCRLRSSVEAERAAKAAAKAAREAEAEWSDDEYEEEDEEEEDDAADEEEQEIEEGASENEEL